jgi:hypothetical protein
MKKRLLSVLFIMALGFLLFSNCTYHNEVDYFGNTADSCVTTNMSFQTDIQPIMQSNCVSCHSSSLSSGGVNLDGYDFVKPYAKSGKLSKVINHKFGVAAMPLNADKLSDCTISKVDAWIAQGYQNN